MGTSFFVDSYLTLWGINKHLSGIIVNIVKKILIEEEYKY